MATIKPLSVSAKRLAATISGSATSFKLDNILTWDGTTNLVAGDFGTKAYAAFRNSAGTLVEFMEIDPSTIASASISILYRGLAYNGDNLTTEISANKLTWVKGDTIVELGTHLPQLLAHYVDIVGAQTIAGVKTFSSLPATTAGDPIANNDLARKGYVDTVVLGTLTTINVIVPGTAGETVANGNLIYFDDTDNEWKLCDADTAATVQNVLLGIAQGAGTNGNAISGGVLLRGVDDAQSGLTQGDTQYASNTAGGISSTPGTFEVTVGIAKSTTELYFDPRFNQQITENQQDLIAAIEAGTDFYAASVVGTDAYAITIAPPITAYATGMKFRFKADVANTGGATLAVSGLTAKTIKKNNDVDLITGDIEAGQIVEVVYDGTNFQMISTAGVVAATARFGGTGADGALSITSGTTTIDCANAKVVVKNYTTISITGTGALAFSNPHNEGTTIILRSQGDVTITSSATRAIDVRSMGGQASAYGIGGGSYGIAGINQAGGAGGGGGGSLTIGAHGSNGSTGTGYTIGGEAGKSTPSLSLSVLFAEPGGAGGDGASGVQGASQGAGGACGKGAGGLVIECAGAYNFAGATIDGAGSAGSAGGNADNGGGGGGGGGGAKILVVYGSVTADSGTYTLTAGAAGSGGTGSTYAGGNGGAGSAGQALRGVNQFLN